MPSLARSFLACTLLPSLLAGLPGQQARLPFDAAQVQLPIDSAPFQRLLDHDGNGIVDAVGARVRADDETVDGFEVRVWTNDGTGVFELEWSEIVEGDFAGASAEPPPLAVGDLDGDGERVPSGLDWVWGEPELADLDGDGAVDATREPLSYPFDGLCARNLGGGVFAWELLDIDGPPSPGVAGKPRLPGDFDGDGDQDLVFGVWRGGGLDHFGLWRNDGKGRLRYSGLAFPRPPGFPGGSLGAENFLTGDLQNDGDLDVVFVYRASACTSFVLLNDGAGTFQLDATYNQGAGSGGDGPLSPQAGPGRAARAPRPPVVEVLVGQVAPGTWW